MSGLSSGIDYAVRGMRYLASHPRLWPWVAAPFAIALCLFGVGIWGGLTLYADFLQWVTDLLPTWAVSWVSGLLHVLVFAVFAVLFYFFYVTLAMLFAAPFNEMVSERMEAELSGGGSEAFSLTGTVGGIALGISHALKRVTAYVLVMGLLFALSFVPVIGALAFAIGGFFVTARFAAFDAMDAVLARKGWRYRQKMQFIKQHSSVTWGLGVAVAGLLLVPIVNLIALPIGAAGATLLWHEHQPR